MASQSENSDSLSSESADSEYASSEQASIQHNAPSLPPRRALGIFPSMALLWVIAIYYFGREFTVQPPWIVFFVMVLFSVPIILSGLYLTTVKKIRKQAGFTTRGWLHRFFSGRIISTFLWCIWALITTFFLLMQFHAYTCWEWIAFFLVIPLFWIIYHLCRNVVGGEMKPYLISAVALGLARRITPVLAFLIYVAILLYFADVRQFDSLRDSIDAHKVIDNEMTRSAIVFELAQLQAYYDGAKDFVLGRLGGVGTTWAILLFSFGGFVVFFNACSMLSCFLIPRREYRRVFTPLSETIIPTPLEPGRIAITTGVFTLVVLFIFLPAFSMLEKEFHEGNKLSVKARGTLDFLVMQIDDKYYQPKTRQEIQNIQFQMIRKLDNVLPELNSELECAFKKMEGNTDLFLDWYYTLSAEYLRTINLLTGKADTYIAEKLEEHLQMGEPFKNYELKIQKVMALQQSVEKQFTEDIKTLLDRNRIEPPEDTNIVLVERLSLPEVLAYKDTIDLEKRLGTTGAASGAAGLATAVIVKKVITKVSAKGAFKVAAKAIAKMVSSKVVSTAGGAAAGAAAGAAIGSVVPAFGTAAGAAIGFVGGIVVGVSVDKGMLMLEEVISREAFKEEILSGIRSARNEYKAQMNLQ